MCIEPNSAICGTPEAFVTVTEKKNVGDSQNDLGSYLSKLQNEIPELIGQYLLKPSPNILHTIIPIIHGSLQ